MNAESEKRFEGLVEDMKIAWMCFEEDEPVWCSADPEGALAEVVGTALGTHESFIGFVAADPALANRDVDLGGASSSSVQHVAWALVYREVLKRVQAFVAASKKTHWHVTTTGPDGHAYDEIFDDEGAAIEELGKIERRWIADGLLTARSHDRCDMSDGLVATATECAEADCRESA